MEDVIARTGFVALGAVVAVDVIDGAIVAGARIERIDCIVAGPTRDQVAAGVAIDGVIAAAAVDRIIAVAAGNEVVAALAVDAIIARAAVDRVRARRTRRSSRRPHRR